MSSRISGFYDWPIAERVARVSTLLSEASASHLRHGGGVPLAVVDSMSENVVAAHTLPIGVALNFRVNHRDVLIPMSIEEPSVVAAASNAARLARMTGGFFGDADESVMTTQVSFTGVADPEAAREAICARKAAILAIGDRAIPRMVARGGGCRDLEVRILELATGFVVVDLFVDVGNAMGANLVDTVAEAVAPALHDCIGGNIGLRILSNLPLRRCVRVEVEVSADALGGAAVADGIVLASRFAELDRLRAVTHNKGIMNGIDAVAVALGQDWRAIEAGAHGYAARAGGYGPLATWFRTPIGIRGRLEMPLAVGTVGGSTCVHQGIIAAFELIRCTDARELAVILGAVGLASNLAALKALSGEGIQRGHMRLHHRKQAGDAIDVERAGRS